MDDWQKRQAREIADRAQLRSIETRLARGENLSDFDKAFLMQHSNKSTLETPPIVTTPDEARGVLLSQHRIELVKNELTRGALALLEQGFENIKLECTASFEWSLEGDGYTTHEKTMFRRARESVLLDHIEDRVKRGFFLEEHTLIVDLEF